MWQRQFIHEVMWVASAADCTGNEMAVESGCSLLCFALVRYKYNPHWSTFCPLLCSWYGFFKHGNVRLPVWFKGLCGWRSTHKRPKLCVTNRGILVTILLWVNWSKLLRLPDPMVIFELERKLRLSDICKILTEKAKDSEIHQHLALINNRMNRILICKNKSTSIWMKLSLAQVLKIYQVAEPEVVSDVLVFLALVYRHVQIL